MREVFIGLLMWLYGIWYSYGHTAYQLIMEVATVSAVVSLLVFIIFKKQLIKVVLVVSILIVIANYSIANIPKIVPYEKQLHILKTVHRTQFATDSFYQQTDDLLNDVYKRIKGFLSEEEFQILKAEELLWISHRDELAAAEHYNSPGYYDALIESTLERTEVLIDSYPQFFY